MFDFIWFQTKQLFAYDVDNHGIMSLLLDLAFNIIGSIEKK